MRQITTFSSWMNESVNMQFDKFWYKIIIMIVLEFMLIWSAFTMGFAFAKIVDEACSSNKTRQQDIQANDHANKDVELARTSNPILQQSVFSHQDLNEYKCISNSGLLETQARVDETSAAHTANNLRQLEEIKNIDKEKKVDGGNAPLYLGTEYLFNKDIQTSKSVSFSTEEQQYSCTRYLCEDIVIQDKIWSLNTLIERYEYYIWAVPLILILIVLWLVVIFKPQFASDKERNMLRSVALGPLGAWTRWGLTRLPEIKALWPDMHPHTFIANISAVTLMCLLTVYGATSWVQSFNAGISAAP